jgi:ketosteroid isomerase-like protein
MRLEDRLKILELIANLAYKHDSLDYEGYKDLYTEDVLRSMRFQNGEPTYMKGRDRGIEGTVDRLKMLTEKGIQQRHYYLTPILEPVSDDEAKGKVSMLIINQQKEEGKPRLSGTGVADLVFHRTGDSWKIAEFHIYFDIPDPRPKLLKT